MYLWELDLLCHLEQDLLDEKKLLWATYTFAPKPASFNISCEYIALREDKQSRSKKGVLTVFTAEKTSKLFAF